MDQGPVTRVSLLARLKAAPHERDWEDFYAQYWAVILSFARQQGLDEHAARDVLQEAMMLVLRKIPEFTYDPQRGRFRNWLFTITANKTREAMRRSKGDRMISISDRKPGDEQALEDRLAAEGPEVTDAIERTWRQSLVEEALRRVQEDPQTKPETFAVFQAYAVEGKPVEAVAAQFGLKRNAVYQIKNRFINRLRKDLAGLEDSMTT